MFSRGSFYINLPIGGVAVAIIILIFQSPPASVSEEARHAPPLEKLLQMDLPGFFAIVAAIVCLLLALQWGGVTKPWNSADVICTFVGFVLITMLFLSIEWWQGSRAMLSPRVLRRREIWSGCVFSFL